jgi:hypothetical protein
MTDLIITALFSLLVLLDVPGPSVAIVRTFDLATLTEQQARQLVGKRVRYRVELDSPETEVDGYHAYGCRSGDLGDERGVYFCPGEVIGEDELGVLVEGTLRIIRQRAWGPVPAYTEYRLVDAVRVRPRWSPLPTR